MLKNLEETILMSGMYIRNRNKNIIAENNI